MEKRKKDEPMGEKHDTSLVDGMVSKSVYSYVT